MCVLDEDRLAERAVALTTRRAELFETARAFDAVAADYDRSNIDNPILAHMRRRALQVLREHVAGGSRLLDLGYLLGHPRQRQKR